MGSATVPSKKACFFAPVAFYALIMAGWQQVQITAVL